MIRALQSSPSAKAAPPVSLGLPFFVGLEPADQRMAHAVAAGNIPEPFAIGTTCYGLIDLELAQLELAAEPDTASLSPGPAITRPSSDKRTFELGNPT